MRPIINMVLTLLLAISVSISAAHTHICTIDDMSWKAPECVQAVKMMLNHDATFSVEIHKDDTGMKASIAQMVDQHTYKKMKSGIITGAAGGLLSMSFKVWRECMKVKVWDNAKCGADLTCHAGEGASDAVQCAGLDEVALIALTTVASGVAGGTAQWMAAYGVYIKEKPHTVVIHLKP